MILLDGHISRMGEDFLTYVNDDVTKWGGCPRRSLWNQHLAGSRRPAPEWRLQNRAFESQKQFFFLKKRAHGLPAELLDVEVVLVLKPAIENSFNNQKHAKKALSVRGWNPFNCAALDHLEILMSAPADVQKKKNETRYLLFAA